MLSVCLFLHVPVEDSSVEEGGGPQVQPAGKIGFKKQRKLEEKQAKKAQREVGPKTEKYKTEPLTPVTCVNRTGVQNSLQEWWVSWSCAL